MRAGRAREPVRCGDNTAMDDDPRRIRSFMTMTALTMLAIAAAAFATFRAGALGFFVAAGLLTATVAVARRIAARRRR